MVDLGEENGAKLAPKWGQKPIAALKRKNQLNTSPLVPNWVRSVEVGSKNRSKIDQKTESSWEGILASVFDGFWWVLGAKLGGKMEPKSSQKGINKNDEKMKSNKMAKSQ